MVRLDLFGHSIPAWRGLPFSVLVFREKLLCCGGLGDVLVSCCVGSEGVMFNSGGGEVVVLNDVGEVEGKGRTWSSSSVEVERGKVWKSRG